MIDWIAPENVEYCAVRAADCHYLVFNWSVTESSTPGVYDFVSLDGDGDGHPGIAMYSGPFLGFSAVFSGTLTAVPLPAAVWLFGSGLIAIAGLACSRKAVY